VRRFVFILLFCCSVLACADAKSTTPIDQPEPPTTCADYLKLLGHARRDVVFIGCKRVQGNSATDLGFEAEYRIEGRDIDKIDRWLSTWTRWERLRFSCCRWDAPSGFYKARNTSTYKIDMFADAWVSGRMIDQRKDLANLPFATLTVTHYLYMP
jgi:hypothetical protein